MTQHEEQPEAQYYFTDDNNSSVEVLSSENYKACNISINQQSTVRCTSNLLKELSNKYPLLEADIQDPTNIKTKERPNSTRRNKTDAEHASKRAYACGVCNDTEHNSRSCPFK
ncbi:7054_t:CDS:2, partial [Racocetra persica]